jgi:hypothetical protein
MTAQRREESRQRKCAEQQRSPPADPQQRHVDAVKIQRPHASGRQRKRHGQTGSPPEPDDQPSTQEQQREIRQCIGERPQPEQRPIDREAGRHDRTVEADVFCEDSSGVGRRRDARRAYPHEVVPQKTVADIGNVDQRNCRNQECRRDSHALCGLALSGVFRLSLLQQRQHGCFVGAQLGGDPSQ